MKAYAGIGAGPDVSVGEATMSDLEKAASWVRAGYTLWLWRNVNGDRVLIGSDETADPTVSLGLDDATVLADLAESLGHKDAERLQRWVLR